MDTRAGVNGRHGRLVKNLGGAADTNGGATRVRAAAGIASPLKIEERDISLIKKSFAGFQRLKRAIILRISSNVHTLLKIIVLCG